MNPMIGFVARPNSHARARKALANGYDTGQVTIPPNGLIQKTHPSSRRETSFAEIQLQYSLIHPFANGSLVKNRSRVRSTGPALRRIAQTMCCLVLLLFLVHAGAQDTEAIQAQADQLSTQSKWAEAAEKYSEVVKANSSNGYAWYSLGECLLQQQKFDEAAQADNNAIAQNFRPLLSNVSLARIAAAKGDREEALSILAKLATDPRAAGVRPSIASSSEFDGLKDDPKYKEIYASLKPCQKSEYRQFDFWVGNWEVHSPSGEVAGNNDVTLEQEGCLIVEHWKSADGVQTGSSFNYYDIRDSKWHQLYIDNSGNAGAFPAMAGSLLHDKMVLLSKEDEGTLSRWTWYVSKPGAVRQMGEQSTDGGKHWKTTWDSVYLKR